MSDEPSRTNQDHPAQPLASLLARVEAATGPDREIDADVEVAVRWVEAARVALPPEHRARWQANRSGHVSDGATTYATEYFTASLDAALALVERVLPNTSAAVKRWASGTGDAEIGGAGVPDTFRARAKTPALALLAALLRALQAQPHRHDARDGSSQKAPSHD